MAEFRNVAQRTYGILLLNAIVLLLHVTFQPFNEASDNFAETVSLTVLTYAASTTAVFPNGGTAYMMIVFKLTKKHLLSFNNAYIPSPQILTQGPSRTPCIE